MPGPDMRINTRAMGVAPMGPPIIASGAPTAVPQYPTTQNNAPIMMPGQNAAAQIDYNALRGFAQASHASPCGRGSSAGCGHDTISLRDIAPPGFIAGIPMWAKILAGVTGLGIVVGVIVYFARR